MARHGRQQGSVAAVWLALCFAVSLIAVIAVVRANFSDAPWFGGVWTVVWLVVLPMLAIAGFGAAVRARDRSDRNAGQSDRSGDKRS